MEIIGVHLDLKGMIFKNDYIDQYIADLKALKINTILIEYEDMFPFQDLSIAVDPEVVWPLDFVKKVQNLASDNGIRIIPLQQCLGHLQYLLRWPEYEHLAQENDYPDTLDITNPKATELIKAMLRQVIEAHPNSQYIHLGMDEASGLLKLAAKQNRAVIDLYTDYLLELLDFVESFDKKAIIFTDMLEDHFDLAVIEKLKGRVILNPWDYESTGKVNPKARFKGWRCSRKWLETPYHPDAPAISNGSKFFDDLPKPLLNIINRYESDEFSYVKSMFQIDFWTSQGFEIIGATASRVSSDGELYPNYHKRSENISSWVDAIMRNSQKGLIATSWARGNTFCSNNFCIDLAWPLIELMTDKMELGPMGLFQGVDQQQFQLILLQLSKCRDNWNYEDSLLEQLNHLTPQVLTHHFEWNGLLLMVKLSSLNKKIDFFFLEIETFYQTELLPEKVWKRLAQDYNRLREEYTTLKDAADSHFSVRYHGKNYQQWLDHLFDIRLQKMTFYKNLMPPMGK